jgi:vitamin B12 transporter
MHTACPQVALFVVLAAGSAGAQQIPVFSDTVVVTASGDDQPAEDVCAAVTVIGRDDIEASGRASVGDLLRWAPGVTVARAGGPGAATSLFIRGGASYHTLVLYDGVRLNSPFFGGYDWSLPLTAGLDRIEVVRGAFSALYGGDAMSGVVQLIPARSSRNGVHALVEGGGSGWRRGEMEVALAKGRWHANVALADREGTGPLANDDFSTTLALGDLSYALRDGGRISLLVRRSAGRTEVPFAGGAVTPHRWTAAGEWQAAVPLTLRLDERTELRATVSTVNRTLRYRDPDDAWGLTGERTDADSLDAEVTIHRRWQHHGLTAGGEWRHDRVSDTTTVGPNLRKREIGTGALFLQDTVAVSRHFSVVGGVRWDRAAAWGSALSPRMTFAYSAGATRVWISAGAAFRAPTLGELYYPLSGNSALRAEHARSGEAGLRLPVPGGRAVLELVGFVGRVRDLIEFDYAAFAFANVGRAMQDGLELSWLALTGSRGRVRTALTYLDAHDGSGQRLLRRPAWSGSLSWQGRLAGSVDGEGDLVWVGPRDDADPVSFARVRQGGFVTVGATLTLPVSTALDVRLRALNLADRRYEEVAGYPALGRQLVLGAAMHL